jgi:hypothetical protein
METLRKGYDDIGGCTRRQPNAVRIECERYVPVQHSPSLKTLVECFKQYRCRVQVLFIKFKTEFMNELVELHKRKVLGKQIRGVVDAVRRG